MEAVIVAGGLGSRLLPLTERSPKHLLPVAGVPFVAHQLAKLAAADITRVVLATSYYAEQFEPVLGNGSDWGVELVYVREAEPLGTAGAIRHVADHLRSGPDDQVVILNGDILSGHDLQAQLTFHRDRDAEITLHLVEVADARAFGCVPTDDDDRVTAFVEKSSDPVSLQINAGCYVFNRQIIDLIPPDRVVSVERETFPQLLAEGRPVLGFVDDAYWLDVGTPAALVKASRDVVRGVASSPAYCAAPAEAWLAADADVSSRSAVLGGSSVGPGARIGAGATVDGSVIFERVQIGAGCQVIDSAVGPGAVIGSNVTLDRVVVGEGAVIESGAVIEPGTSIP